MIPETNFEKAVGAGYLVMATLQVIATWQGLEVWLDGLPRAILLVGAGAVGAVPLLGSITGMWGAMNAWGWSFLPSLLVFFWYIPALIIAAAFGAGANRRPA